MRTKTFAILILLALSGITAYPVYAAKWHTVASQDGERIQIDTANRACGVQCFQSYQPL